MYAAGVTLPHLSARRSSLHASSLEAAPATKQGKDRWPWRLVALGGYGMHTDLVHTCTGMGATNSATGQGHSDHSN